MIFVTGGTGLIGSHILLKLLQDGHSVRALKRKNSSMKIVQSTFSHYQQNELLKSIEWVNGDILDFLSLDEAIEGCQKVIHCAAIVSFSAKDAQQMLAQNINGTANIVNCCSKLNISKLLHISSVAALGNDPTLSIKNEECNWKEDKTNTIYSRSKYLSEQEVWRGIAEGLNAVIVNPSIVLGPGDWNKGSSQMFQKVWQGLKYYSSGGTGYVDVLDVAEISIQLLESDIINERFIINAENLKYKTVFEWIAEELNRPKPSVKVTPLLKEVAWRLEWLKSVVTAKKPLITKETANKAMITNKYSNEKVRNHLSYSFIPIRQSVSNYGKWFLKEQTT